ncbi:hypothetical protein D3C72_1893700 [compost metagenome]
MIGRNGPDGGLPAQLHQMLESLVVHGCGGRCGILRIKREKQDFFAALFLQGVDLRGD